MASVARQYWDRNCRVAGACDHESSSIATTATPTNKMTAPEIATTIRRRAPNHSRANACATKTIDMIATASTPERLPVTDKAPKRTAVAAAMIARPPKRCFHQFGAEEIIEAKMARHAD